VQGDFAHIEGYYYRPELNRRFGHALLVLRRGADRRWLIAAEASTFPGPFSAQEIDAARVIAQLDEAGISRAAVLSVAYWFGSGERISEGEQERVRTENDWVAAEVARYPTRLVAFCSFNPLRDYALAELNRCADTGAFRGIKLHFGNSGVDALNHEHQARLRAVFAAANARRMAIIVHLWTGPEYEASGADNARAFLTEILPAAPDVPVQIAHLAGGGRSTLEALAVYANAIATNNAATRHLYFDVATVAEGESAERLAQDADLMRRIGMERILYGTDTSPPNLPARNSWAALRMLPLTEREFATISSNVAPYMQ
jgi:predicted TIM-barrel fold metal-dependent hydrolase